MAKFEEELDSLPDEYLADLADALEAEVYDLSELLFIGENVEAMSRIVEIEQILVDIKRKILE